MNFLLKKTENLSENLKPFPENSVYKNRKRLEKLTLYNLIPETMNDQAENTQIKETEAIVDELLEKFILLSGKAKED